MANNLDDELDMLKNEEKSLNILKKEMKSLKKNNLNEINNNFINPTNFENDLGFDSEMVEITEHLDEFKFSDFEGKLNKIELTPNKSTNFKKNKGNNYNDISLGKSGNKLRELDTVNKSANKKQLLYTCSTTAMIKTPQRHKNLLNSNKKDILKTEEKKKNSEFSLLTKKLTTPSNSKNNFVKIFKK